MSFAIEKRSWQPSLRKELQSLGIQLCKSKYSRTCQLCWKHKSKYRRLCPICDKLIAPGCWPVKCWNDELNHCRDCHTVSGIMRYHRYKKQFMPNNPDKNVQRTQSNVISYLDFPVGGYKSTLWYEWPNPKILFGRIIILINCWVYQHVNVKIVHIFTFPVQHNK